MEVIRRDTLEIVPEEVAYSLASRLMISDAGRFETSDVAWNISMPKARASSSSDSSR